MGDANGSAFAVPRDASGRRGLLDCEIRDRAFVAFSPLSRSIGICLMWMPFFVFLCCGLSRPVPVLQRKKLPESCLMKRCVCALVGRYWDIIGAPPRALDATPSAQAQLILTITPDGQMLVSARAADGTLTPSRKIAVDRDWRLGAFVAKMQALARQQLAPVESATIGPRETATQRSLTRLGQTGSIGCHGGLDAASPHCCAAWNKLIDQPWRIMSIGLRRWAHGF